MENPADFSKVIKKSFLDGIFYPSDKNRIKDMIYGQLEIIQNSDFFGKDFLIPHGAWDFCLSEYIYLSESLIRSRPDITVIFLPYHDNFNSSLYFCTYKEYVLPNGTFCFTFPGNFSEYGKDLSISNNPFDEQTSLESFLPVLTEIYPECRLFPVFFDMNVGSESVVKILEILFAEYNNPSFIVSANINSPEGLSHKNEIYPFFKKADLYSIDFCCNNFLSIFRETLDTELMLSKLYQKDFNRKSGKILHLLFNIITERKNG